MAERDIKISRRTFNKLAFGSAAALGTLGALEATQVAITEWSEQLRNKTPNYLSVIHDGSIRHGAAPDKNRALDYIREVQIGHHYLLFFVDGDLQKDREILEEIRKIQDLGIIPILSWGRKNASDKTLLAFAQELKTIPDPKYIRGYYEGNGKWTRGWYGHRSAEEYIEKWIKLYTFMRNFGIDSPFIFCPNTTEDIFGTEPIEKYYPGDAYVEVVALDAYLKWSKYLLDPEHWFYPNLVNSKKVLSHDLAVLQETAPGKEIFICEFNVTPKTDNRSGKLVGMMQEAAYAGAKAIISFDWNQWLKERIDWRLFKDPLVFQAYLNELAQPYYMQFTK